MNQLTRQGIAAYKAGNKTEAQRLLKLALQQDPNDIPAWLCLSGAVDEAATQAYCFQMVLRLDPKNQIALKGMAKIEQNRGQAAGQVFPPQESPAQPDFRAQLFGAAPFTTHVDEGEIEIASPSQPQPVWEEATPWPVQDSYQPEPGAIEESIRESAPVAPPEVGRPAHSPKAAPARAARKKQRKPGTAISPLMKSLARKTAFKPWMWAALGGMALIICISLMVLFSLISSGLGPNATALPPTPTKGMPPTYTPTTTPTPTPTRTPTPTATLKALGFPTLSFFPAPGVSSIRVSRAAAASSSGSRPGRRPALPV